MNNIDYNKDYYKILGVEKNATEDDIKRSFRKLAVKHHPDHQQGKSDAEKEEANRKFQEINEANEVLSDKESRAEYDQVRAMGGRRGMGGRGFHSHGGGFGEDMMRDFMRRNGFGMGGMSDFGFGGSGFSNAHFRQTPRRDPIDGQNIHINVSLPFESFFYGCTKTLDIKVNNRCNKCKNGLTGDNPEYTTCPNCNGQGMTVSRQGNMIMQETCGNCGGSGQILKNKCPHCNGTTVIGTRTQSCTFEIPKFSYSGFTHTYDGVGHCGRYGGKAGNITITANMDESGRFTLNSQYDNETLRTIHFVPILKALIGGKERILTPYGYEEVEIPCCTENPTEIRIKNNGMKRRTSNDNADLVVELHWDVPKNITDGERETIQKALKTMCGRKGVFDSTEKLKEYDKEYEKMIKETFSSFST